MRIEVLFQDEDLLFINKPAGIASQSSVDKSRPDVLSVLKQQLNSESVFLHHRLDIGTSGVMVFVLHSRSNKAMTEIFREKKAQKKYLALTKRPCQIDKQWEVKNYLRKINRGQRQKMASVTSGGDPAHTLFECLASSSEKSLVLCTPLTGRTHQIRVHLAEGHLPILGDKTYGGQSPEASRLMLHALSLELPHPRTEKLIKIVAPLASDFSRLLERHLPNWNAKHRLSI